MKNKNIVVILVLMLLALIFVTPVSARSSIPIELALTVEPSTITVGGTSTVTVRLLDEDGKPVVTEADIHVNLSATFGSMSSSIVIPAGKNSSSTKFTSKYSEVSRIAVISAGSRGLVSDTVSIVAMPSPSKAESVNGGVYSAPPPEVSPAGAAMKPEVSPADAAMKPEETESKKCTSGFEAIFAIAGLFAVIYRLRRGG